ncbi:MAG: hypothetical protein WDN28_19675 [Chthoniobacter sp.]
MLPARAMSPSPSSIAPKASNNRRLPRASFGFDALLEVPQRLGVGNGVADPQPKEALETRPIEDLLFGGIIAQP